jgi:type IV pilus assembly protein PilM
MKFAPDTHRLKNIFLNAFPVPKYLAMPAVGINISDYAIKHVQLGRERGKTVLVSYGKIDLPLGTVERGEIKDMGTLVKLLTRTREEFGYQYVHLALPEEHAYLFQMEIPRGSAEEVQQMLEFHLKENVPIGADEAVFDYNVITEKPNAFEVNVSVYPIAIASDYVNVLRESGLTPISTEIEGQATARALLESEHTAPTLIIDIGRNEASLSISTNSIVTFTATLETGGDVFTRAIARGLDMSFQEAEKLKRKHGFRDSKEDSAVFEQLAPIMIEFKEAIRKHLLYWQMHTSAGGEKLEEVTRVVLVGGNANIEGLPEYLEEELSVPVEVGNVWKQVFDFETYTPTLHANRSMEYATAVGLALRSLVRE